MYRSGILGSNFLPTPQNHVVQKGPIRVSSLQILGDRALALIY